MFIKSFEYIFEMHVFERKLKFMKNEEGLFQSCQSVPGMFSRMVDHQFYSFGHCLFKLGQYLTLS